MFVSLAGLTTTAAGFWSKFNLYQLLNIFVRRRMQSKLTAIGCDQPQAGLIKLATIVLVDNGLKET